MKYVLLVTILAYYVFAVLAWSRQGSSPIVSKLQEPQTLRFKVSARDLADQDLIGTTDPFVKMFAQRGDGWVLFGTSEVVRDVLNVNWEFVFKYNEFIPGSNQFWKIEIWDHDRLGRDALLGNAMLNIDSYFKSNQVASVPLSTKGTVTLQKAD